MKKITFNILLLSFLLNACSSKHEVISVTNTHAYDSNYGIMQNYAVDAHIEQEIQAQNHPVEIEKYASNPNWTTELTIDPDAVTADNYVQAPEVISYKYKFDPKFYDEAVWRSNK